MSALLCGTGVATGGSGRKMLLVGTQSE